MTVKWSPKFFKLQRSVKGKRQRASHDVVMFADNACAVRHKSEALCKICLYLICLMYE